MSEFIHLHNHSHFSLLDGAATIDGLVDSAVQNRMKAVALTDHGVMFGAIEFYKTATKAGIKPILGCEVYIVVNGSCREREIDAKSFREGRGRGIYHHLVLLAKNLTGYQNLVRLVSLGHTEGFYYKPRIDMELLAKHREGLVCLSACPSGVVAHHLVNGNPGEARNVAGMFKDLFGKDFYLEIQNHGLEKETPILKAMPGLAKDLGLPLICTNDVHYIKQEHSIAHNVLLMIPDASAQTTSDYRQLRYQTDQIYFKTPKEMCELFRDYPEAIKSTLEVTEKIEEFSIERKPCMPDFPIPPGAIARGAATLEQYLETLTREGLARRYQEITPVIEERIAHELAVINRMGYAGYFLITQDFISEARRMGVVVGPGRGSAAGSLVSYALGITNVDPLKFDLLFERFLNPERVSMPDIDVDFSDSKRDKVIEYVRTKYGAESVSQIITFGSLSSRAVLKDVGRVLGVPLSTVESITKQIPVIQGKVTPLAEIIGTNPELKWVKESKDEKIREMVSISLVLEGMNRNASTHAAGVVIAPGPITEYVPVFKTPQTDVMTQYSMLDLEKAGLLKMDFLGLRTLTCLENTLALIREKHGIDIDLDTIPDDDPATFALFGRGHTVGLFQFESSGMQDWLRKLRPSSVSDLVAMNALYRPGPMEMIGDFIRRKQGQQKIEYLHPKLEPILRETYGIIVYQEQVMKIASEVAGFSLANADLLRRAMGKKDKEAMAKEKTGFIEGAVKRSYTRKIASDIFDMIEKFASYGFNKSHSVAYSVLAYQTGWLKAHYPAEFMAATISAEIGDTDYVVELIEECRKMGINVLPPDINESNVGFTVTPSGIRFGLSAIKNVGVGAVESIIASRSEKGPYGSLFDFCRRVDLRLVNKKTIEALIFAGSLDSITLNRAQLFGCVEKAIQFGQESRAQSSRGQSSLFEISTTSERPVDILPAMPAAEGWPEGEKLGHEKEVLGFYLTGHPLRKYAREMASFATVELGNPSSAKPGVPVRAGGIVSSVKKKIDRKGNMMAFVTLEDFTGKGELICFSDTYRQFGEFLVQDSMVMVGGTAEQSGDALRIIVKDVVPMERTRAKYARSVVLSVRVDDVGEETVSALRKVAEKHKGNCSCYFDLIRKEGERPMRLHSTKYVVDASNEFVAEVEGLLGPDSVRFSN